MTRRAKSAIDSLIAPGKRDGTREERPRPKLGARRIEGSRPCDDSVGSAAPCSQVQGLLPINELASRNALGNDPARPAYSSDAPPRHHSPPPASPRSPQSPPAKPHKTHPSAPTTPKPTAPRATLGPPCHQKRKSAQIAEMPRPAPAPAPRKARPFPAPIPPNTVSPAVSASSAKKVRKSSTARLTSDSSRLPSLLFAPQRLHGVH